MDSKIQTVAEISAAEIRPVSEPKPEWRRPSVHKISVAETLVARGSFTDGDSGSEGP